MSREIWMRAFLSAAISLLFAWELFQRHDNEIGKEYPDGTFRKYNPYVPCLLLPALFLMYFAITLIFYGPAITAKQLFSMCFSIFLHISAYYFILLFAMPLLRRYISARACAMLWMIPNYLYILMYDFSELPNPHFVIYVSETMMWIICSLWIAGFFTVITWKTIEHLVFRHRVLKNAAPVTDSDIRLAWSRALMDTQVKKPLFKLVVSPNVQTPLSVGLFQRTTKVILPERSYSSEELELIFKHEIIHILRQDSWAKYFLVFCTAVCWFNPLMWIAMKKGAEDLELSCDETVLLQESEEVRQKYASLLLRTAGDERGFTTCLSASAQALRYRLMNIIKPAKRRSGAILVGVIFFILCMSGGYVSMAYNGRNGAEIIYKSGDFSKYSLSHVSLTNDYSMTDFEIVDEQAFHEYLSELTLYEFTGNYSFSAGTQSCTYLLDSPDGTLGILLYDHALKLTYVNERGDSSYYYIKENTDWDYLSTIIIPHSSPDM